MPDVARTCLLTVVTTLFSLPVCFWIGYELAAVCSGNGGAGMRERAARAGAVELLGRAPIPTPKWIYNCDTASWWAQLRAVNLRAVEPPRRRGSGCSPPPAQLR